MCGKIHVVLARKTEYLLYLLFFGHSIYRSHTKLGFYRGFLIVGEG